MPLICLDYLHSFISPFIFLKAQVYFARLKLVWPVRMCHYRPSLSLAPLFSMGKCRQWERSTACTVSSTSVDQTAAIVGLWCFGSGLKQGLQCMLPSRSWGRAKLTQASCHETPHSLLCTGCSSWASVDSKSRSERNCLISDILMDGWEWERIGANKMVRCNLFPQGWRIENQGAHSERRKM